MKEKIKKIYYKILWLLPKKIAIRIKYLVATHKKLDMKNPKDFNQKILYLLVNKYGKLEEKCADKFGVREYIKEKGLAEHLPKLYHVYEDANEIKFDDLPQEYVLKTNHGCGCTIIHEKDAEIDKQKIIDELNESLKINWAKKTLEYQYENIKPLIICEEYIKEEGLKNPTDYKFYCFKGKVECVLLCSEREKELKLDYYDLNWKKLNYAKEEYRSNSEHKKPKNLNEMINIASKLSEDFPWVRVDLYNLDGKIYIGELTFTPAAGIIKYNTQESLEYLGNLIEL